MKRGSNALIKNMSCPYYSRPSFIIEKSVRISSSYMPIIYTCEKEYLAWIKAILTLTFPFSKLRNLICYLTSLIKKI